MNFKKLSQIMEDNKFYANQHVNNPNNYNKEPPKEPPLGMAGTNPNPSSPSGATREMSKSDNNTMMRKIEDKLGVDKLTYRPLLVHLAKNNEAMQLFDRLLANVATMNASSAGNIMKASHNLYTAR